jgi:hypothetical protein
MTLVPSRVRKLAGTAGSATDKIVSTISTSVGLVSLFFSSFQTKSILLVIVFANGRSGFLGEHSSMDGTPTLRMNEFMLATLANNKVDLGPERNASTGAHLPEPIELKFVLDNAGEIERMTRNAQERFDALIAEHDLHVGIPYISLLRLTPFAGLALR